MSIIIYFRVQLTRIAVEKAFADDFNTPQALANVMRLIKFTNQVLGSKEGGNSVSFVNMKYFGYSSDVNTSKK